VRLWLRQRGLCIGAGADYRGGFGQRLSDARTTVNRIGQRRDPVLRDVILWQYFGRFCWKFLDGNSHIIEPGKRIHVRLRIIGSLDNDSCVIEELYRPPRIQICPFRFHAGTSGNAPGSHRVNDAYSVAKGVPSCAE